MLDQFRCDDDVLRRDDVDAMCERGAAKIGVEERDDAPTLLMPSQIAMYSGRFGISRQTVSPLSMSRSSAQRA